ncbi:site-specific integrase [Pseudomonas sp. PDM20]|uniref:site-specific integrase n=1 Tax=Pseudomonas sp. PDM20 TaxID=2769254 RepID=UPI0017833A1C|nr:site-specific integrase [Pseudomonas sp. PDM20]MBD9686872.1 site-specific integrase [Pseudomonas sp. PDM20]
MSALVELEFPQLQELLYEGIQTVISRQGFKVDILSSDGSFEPHIILPDNVGEFQYLNTEKLQSLSGSLKDICVGYLIFIISRYQAGTVKDRFLILQKIAIDAAAGVPVADSLRSLSATSGFLISGIKEFSEYLVLHEYDEDSYWIFEEICSLKDYSDNSNGYLNLFMMDDERGPFTKDEMLTLSSEVENSNHSVESRLALALFLELGLRPIQVALLKRTDFIFDENAQLYYLRVPRVKSRQRDWRGQFKVRVLSDRTAQLLIMHIESTDISMIDGDVDQSLLPIFFSGKEMNRENFHVCRELWALRNRESKKFYVDAGKVESSYHRGAHYLWRLISSLENSIPISSRTGKQFKLFPYRFRYTVGTQAVISGYGPEEVADMLDHSSTYTVKHYFRFSSEMWEILEKASNSRIEHKHFSAAWLRQDLGEENMFTRPIYESRTFTVVGKCALKETCFDEPAVACYGCNKFCPNSDKAAHFEALKGLLERRESASQSTSAAMLVDVERAIDGCKAAIILSDANDADRVVIKELIS